MLSLKVQVPFWICTLIWGTTWFVILGQLGIVPATWSVTYRFLVAGAVMFVYAWITRQPIHLNWRQQRFAMLFGGAQFTHVVDLDGARTRVGCHFFDDGVDLVSHVLNAVCVQSNTNMLQFYNFFFKLFFLCRDFFAKSCYKTCYTNIKNQEKYNKK